MAPWTALLAAAGLAVGAPPPAIFVKRSSGHSGSKWIATAFARRNLSTFFQFGGICAGRCCRTPSPETQALRLHDRVAALERLFATGCACLGAPNRTTSDDSCENCGGGRALAPPDATPAERACRWNAYCRGCAGPGTSCAGVAAVAPEPDDADTLAALPRARAHNAYFRAVAALLPRVLFVTWDRDNVAKHALSYLKHNHGARCALPALANHAHASISQRAFLHIQPTRYLQKATEKALGRLGLDIAFAGVRVAYRAHYEDFQLDEAEATRRLFRALGLAPPSQSRAPDLVKLTPEGLPQLVVNFEEVAARFDAWPCLAAQLRSPAPEHFAACALHELPARGNLSHAGARGATAVDCAAPRGRAAASACRGAHRLAPGRPTAVCMVS
jgi:hypothetical protein